MKIYEKNENKDKNKNAVFFPAEKIPILLRWLDLYNS